MTFFFEDGEQVDIGGQQAHSFISQDLNWVVQAHGRLIDVVYGRSAAIGQQDSSIMPKALEAPMLKCKALASRASRIFRREAVSAPARCCA